MFESLRYAAHQCEDTNLYHAYFFVINFGGCFNRQRNMEIILKTNLNNTRQLVEITLTDAITEITVHGKEGSLFLEIEKLIYQDVWFSRLVLKTKRLVVLNALEKLSLVFNTTCYFQG